MDGSRRFDATLTEEGQCWRLLDAISGYAIYLLDRDGFVTRWNIGAQHMTGYTAAEMTGRHVSCLFSGEDQKRGAPGAALDVCMRQGCYQGEGWRVRKDGTWFWVQARIDPVFSRHKVLIGFATVLRRIDGRDDAPKGLKSSEHQFELLVKGVSDYAIYMLDPQGRIVTWNPGAEKIKGYRPEEIIGSHISRFFTSEDRAAGACERALAIAARDGHFETEAWRLRKDGSRFWANSVIDAIRDEDGKLAGFAKITRDITERLEAQRVLDRTRQELFQSQKIEALGKLTGGVAHDFNNLLGATLGSLELVRKYLPPNFAGMSLFENAVQGAERGVLLTQRLLSFGRKQDLKPEAADVGGLVHGIEELIQRAIGPSIVLKTSFPDGLPAIFADINQLELALLNLAMNARDAMPAGGVLRITARTMTIKKGRPPVLKPGRYVCLAVCDTGEGMDAMTLARATEPFFTTKGVGKGTGLGLSMVHGMAEQSGGQFVLSSRKGVGTTAEIRLPVAGEATSAGASRFRVPASPPSRGRPLSVLAVDDDPIFLVATTAMLRDLGHAVSEANSGQEALDLLQWERAFDLVITDHLMPQMTGVQLARTIQEGWPHLPVLLATGYADMAANLANDLPQLSKPFQQADLAHAVAALVH